MSSITYPVLKAEDLLAYQLNGPIAGTLFSTFLQMLQNKDDWILTLVNLTIDSAFNGLLDDYGTLLGAPRPLFAGSTWFRFDQAVLYPSGESDEGLGSVTDDTLGGMLWSTGEIPDVVINKLSDENYRKYLKACIILRFSRSVLSLLAVLEASNLVVGEYPLVSFDEHNDIVVTLSTLVEDSYVDLLQDLYDKYYNTSPRVTVVKA